MQNLEVLTLAQRLVGNLGPEAGAAFFPHLYRDHADFSALEAIEKNYVPGAPPPVHPEGSWLSFVFCKPSIEQGIVHIHLLEPSKSDAPRSNELWIKVKRADALVGVIAGTSAAEQPASLVNRAIVMSAAQTLGKDASGFAFEDDLVVASGPEWLRTDISLREESGKTFVRSPVTLSPIDAPPRFAGMHYMKVVSPHWAAERLMSA